MTLTTTHSEIAVNGGSLFIRFAGRELFVHRPHGQPFRFRSVARSGTDMEVWGLGFYGVLSLGRAAPPGAPA